MQWIADGGRYYAQAGRTQYLLEERAGSWVLRILEHYGAGEPSRLIVENIDAGSADEALEIAGGLV